ncbi:hypothetical protein ZHAS_00007225 [Anopheles sinensis]|uniref:Uncharacterized protein n=1 Tax=Anopheles sinensis TaxID=74873 RepID=A0A084VPF9_ANOSI|nr:hypothetical protein ZHAS_00007225 [Anopheles sinensis]
MFDEPNVYSRLWTRCCLRAIKGPPVELLADLDSAGPSIKQCTTSASASSSSSSSSSSSTTTAAALILSVSGGDIRTNGTTLVVGATTVEATQHPIDFLSTSLSSPAASSDSRPSTGNEGPNEGSTPGGASASGNGSSGSTSNGKQHQRSSNTSNTAAIVSSSPEPTSIVASIANTSLAHVNPFHGGNSTATALTNDFYPEYRISSEYRLNSHHHHHHHHHHPHHHHHHHPHHHGPHHPRDLWTAAAAVASHDGILDEGCDSYSLRHGHARSTSSSWSSTLLKAPLPCESRGLQILTLHSSEQANYKPKPTETPFFLRGDLCTPVHENTAAAIS